jgi:hypothetical protein
MTASTETILAAAQTLAAAAVSAEVVAFRPQPTTLKDKVSVSVYESGRDRNQTGGKHNYLDLVFAFGVLFHAKMDDSLRAAEAYLNNTSDALVSAVQGTNNAYWVTAVFLKGSRPPSPPGASNIRFGNVIMRFKLR